MKNLCTFRHAILLIPFSLSLTGNSQNVAINATGNQADPSAMLDVSSQTAGVLIPRMSTSARNAISSPATGLQIFNTDCNELNYWTGTCWISTGSLPAPDPISSNSATVLCALSTATYSIPAITGATRYAWIVPAGAVINSGQGTTSVSVTWGNITGDVCVRAYDVCESSEQTCMGISINPIPPTPGNITGLATVSPGQTNVSYFIASIPGASSYTWSVPAGATITTGTGTPVITVSFACNAVSGNVSVTAGSNCGTSTASGQAITVTSYLAANAGSAVFGGSALGSSPAATGGLSPYTYSWLPNSNLSSSTVANPTALCSGSTTTYTLNVTDANGCTASSSVVVTRNLTASAGSAVFGGVSIGGSPTATGGISPYAYSWSPNSNLSGNTVANPTALCNGSTTTYTLTLTDANGCIVTNNVVVTRNLTANAGSAVFGGALIGGSPTVTGGNSSSYIYSWNPNINLSSSSVSNPTAQCSGSTTTYTVTINDANGCTATSSVAVTRSLIASAGANNSICSGNSASIGGSPTAAGGKSNSYTYSWNPTTNLSSSAIANPTANPSSTSTYAVTVTDANGCTATSSMSLTVNQTPAAAGSISGTNSTCQGASGMAYSVGTITNASGYTWTYTGNGFSIASGSNTNSITANFSNSATSGILTVYGTNSGCNGTVSANYSITISSSSHGSQTFNANGSYNTGSVQSFTIPSCISSITITAYGSQGAGDPPSEGSGGLGASIQGTFTVVPGNVLNIMVGQKGNQDNNNSFGGGGGSFVWNTSSGNTLMVAAGGGGGAGINVSGSNGGAGSATNTPTSGFNYCAAGGSGGNGGSGGTNGTGSYGGGGGGAGWSSNGANGQTGSNQNPAGGGGQDPLAGGTGGVAGASWGSVGGYGGAGGGGLCGGGGGGYNGGGGGNAYPINSTSGAGGGGGSYNNGTNPTNTQGVQSGNGQVIISY